MSSRQTWQLMSPKALQVLVSIDNLKRKQVAMIPLCIVEHDMKYNLASNMTEPNGAKGTSKMLFE